MILMSCLCGAACAMGLWAAATAHATIEEVVRRGGGLFPPGEP